MFLFVFYVTSGNINCLFIQSDYSVSAWLSADGNPSANSMEQLLYDADAVCCCIAQTKLTNCMSTSLGVPDFKEAEYAFMNEEMQVPTPLAQGLDRLQGHANPESYTTFLYPTLLQLRHNYTELENIQVLIYCSPIVIMSFWQT